MMCLWGAPVGIEERMLRMSPPLQSAGLRQHTSFGSLSLNMAAVLDTQGNPLEDRTIEPSEPATPLLATTAITNTAQLFPISKWAPRQGRNRAYVVWESSVRQLLAAFGLTWEQLGQHELRGLLLLYTHPCG